MPLAHLDLLALRQWVITARAGLAAYADELNQLNVFPVPDGDTGSNLLMTIDCALEQLGSKVPLDVRSAADTMARATLTSARGNSGVILSQLTRGVAEVVAQIDTDELNGHHIAAILSRASQLACAGVSRPEAGTVLTVAGAAASAATVADAGGASLLGVVDAAVADAGDALMRTRTEHEVLRRSGVIDAGGAGYMLAIEALQRVVRGDSGFEQPSGERPEWLRFSADSDQVQASALASLDGCGDCGGRRSGTVYEVMFLLADATDAQVTTLKRTLDGLGDSLVIAGGEDLRSVHVHVDDVADVVNAAVEAGRAHRFVITRFTDEIAVCVARLRVLALVESDEIGGIASSSGVEVIRGAEEEQLCQTLAKQDADTLLLCGDRAARDVAERCCKNISPRRNSRLHIVGGSSVELIAALAMLDSDIGYDEAVTTLDDAVGAVQWIDVVGGASDDARVREALDFVDRVAVRRELVTLVVGADADTAWGEGLADRMRSSYPPLEVVVVIGGPAEPLLTIGVE